MDKRYMALGTSMLVLRLLEQESMYGYQIIRELEQQSRSVFQLQEGTLRRAYLAVCEGVPVPRRGCVEAPIARAPGSVLKREVNPQGAPARTHYEVLATGRGRSLVALRLDTGRTHQIRVHLAHLGCPLVGDFLYGEETEELPDRFALHSAAIWLRQPITGEGIVRRSPLPEALAGLLGTR